MKNPIYKIETRRGWVAVPEMIGGYSFPLSTSATCQGATEFFSRARAEKTIKKFNLDKGPFHAHIETFEWQTA